MVFVLQKVPLSRPTGSGGRTTDGYVLVNGDRIWGDHFASTSDSGTWSSNLAITDSHRVPSCNLCSAVWHHARDFEGQGYHVGRT